MARASKTTTDGRAVPASSCCRAGSTATVKNGCRETTLRRADTRMIVPDERVNRVDGQVICHRRGSFFTARVRLEIRLFFRPFSESAVPRCRAPADIYLLFYCWFIANPLPFCCCCSANFLPVQALFLHRAFQPRRGAGALLFARETAPYAFFHRPSGGWNRPRPFRRPA